MRKISLFVLLTVSICVFSSCQVMQKKDCEKADWGGQGYRDATKGYPKSHFSKHQKACLSHGITADVKTYAKGYNAGIKKFCTYKEGYRYGNDGKSYKDTCPEELEAEFFKGYVEGKKVRTMEERNEELKKQREEAEDDNN